MCPAPRSVIVLLAIFWSNCASAQQYAHLRLKAENSLVIAWDGASTDADENQITVSDVEGHPVTTLNVLRPVQEARRVGIYDVSARGNLIAVAAVYGSKQGNRQVHPVASLLLFDFSGRLLSAFALEPSREIELLAIDGRSNIWTLTDGAGTGVDPSTVPMVVEYSPEGKIVREVLKRNLFPFHATFNRQDIDIGSPAMGYSSGVVWFWLPGSTDFVTISTSDAKATVMKTQLPKKAGRKEMPLSVARESSGNVLLQVREDDDQLRPEVQSEVAYYSWSPSTNAWSQFKPGACEPGRLIGVSDKGQVHLHYEAGRTTNCIFGEAP